MFDEMALAGKFGPIKSDQIKAGSIGQFNYEHGYHFSVTPDRIDIRHSGRYILPNPLVVASKSVARQLEPLRRVVSAVGINCDADFYSHEIGMTGNVFCRALTENHLFRRIYEGYPNVATSSVTTTFPSAGGRVQQYNVRFEPDERSEQEDLFVAINAHQNVTGEVKLTEKLDTIVISEVRAQIEQIHRKILSPGGV